MLTLMMPTFAEEPASSEVVNQTEEEQLVPRDSFAPQTSPSQEVEELPPAIETQLKQPVSKKKIAKKFLLAMSGVAISAILLFLILTVYNKIRAGIFGQTQENPNGETSLVTPDSLPDAVRTFIDKTKWE